MFHLLISVTTNYLNGFGLNFKLKYQFYTFMTNYKANNNDIDKYIGTKVNCSLLMHIDMHIFLISLIFYIHYHLTIYSNNVWWHIWLNDKSLSKIIWINYHLTIYFSSFLFEITNIQNMFIGLEIIWNFSYYKIIYVFLIFTIRYWGSN